MKQSFQKDFFIVGFISILYGLLAIPVELLILYKSTSLGFMPLISVAFRTCGLVALIVALFSTFLLFILRLYEKKHPSLQKRPKRQAIIIASGIFALLFLLMFENYYDKFKALVVVELIGGLIFLVMAWLSDVFLRAGNRSKWLDGMSPKFTVIGFSIIVVLFVVTFSIPRETFIIEEQNDIIAEFKLPNILFLVWDTVRADHMSLYGYKEQTTPFLEKMAIESSVFENAFAASPWTLPSHATLFTGFYLSQHGAHAEHMILDDSFRTLAEILHDNGYQTICFSNNAYISSYHNMLQGFERTWFKGRWTEEIDLEANSLRKRFLSFYYWLWDNFKKYILVKLIRNPTSIWDVNPNAHKTNVAVTDWLDKGRDENRPFFVFINYMDAHLPYNPGDETARLFLNDEELKDSYKEKLRNPPFEYFLDLKKGGYTQSDIRMINSLYDACVRGLDNELEILVEKLRSLNLNDNTLIIITSDHGEYLGERNRLAHGLGLHDELLHIPLVIRYPSLFKLNSRNRTVVTHIDIFETILAISKIEERPEGVPETQCLYEIREDCRPFVFGEFRFPLHVLISTSLLADNSHLFVEQKMIRNQMHQFIWKSRGEFEFYNNIDDPRQVNNLYSRSNEHAAFMNHYLMNWFDSLYIPSIIHESRELSEKETMKLKDQLRALGYIK